MKLYTVSLTLFNHYDGKKVKGLQSATVIVEADDKFQAMSKAWRMIEPLSGGLEEPKEVSARSVNE